MIGKFFETDSFDGRNLFVASFTEVSIVSIKCISLDHSIETLIDILLVLDIETDGQERLFSL